MKLKRLLVENYKSLRCVEIPLSNFVCIIGENNSGKSSILQALALFFSGSPLEPKDFFDPEQEIRIELEFTDIKEPDIERLEKQQREIVRQLLKGDALTLVRKYTTDGKSKLKLVSLLPQETRFLEESIAELTRGQKPGAAFKQTLDKAYPEIADSFTNSTKIGEARELIRKLANRLPDDQKDKGDTDLPTGLDAKDKGILRMLPEPIYIQAVKDLTDDTKTKEGTPFGKVLGVLLRAIEGKLNEETELFRELKYKLNRVEREDGSCEDNRLEEVQVIERTVERYVQESFPAAKLKITIPPPEIKAVLQGAQIFVDDGVEGLIDTKGDGLRRSVVFAIMRAYVDLGKMEQFSGSEMKTGNYLLLFEEPELYLHPKAQDILFKALSEFSKSHSVVVTTHSPRFFGPGATSTFIKMKKESNSAHAGRPFAAARPVDLGDVNAKDQFQLICYENNNAAFFSDNVVLVEGDSDFIVLKHIASLLHPARDGKASISFIRINGKGNIKRYKDFFNRFDVRVHIVSDLDLIISGFDLVEPTEELIKLRRNVICKIESCCETDSQKLEKLQDPPTKCIKKLKMQLITSLRDIGVHVLTRGHIEDYYPKEIVGNDKLSKALCFCSKLCTRDEVVECCDMIPVGDGTKEKEFLVIFKSIFGDNSDVSRVGG